MPHINKEINNSHAVQIHPCKGSPFISSPAPAPVHLARCGPLRPISESNFQRVVSIPRYSYLDWARVLSNSFKIFQFCDGTKPSTPLTSQSKNQSNLSKHWSAEKTEGGTPTGTRVTSSNFHIMLTRFVAIFQLSLQGKNIIFVSPEWKFVMSCVLTSFVCRGARSLRGWGAPNAKVSLETGDWACTKSITNMGLS